MCTFNWACISKHVLRLLLRIDPWGQPSLPDQWLTLVTPCVLIRPVGHRERGLFVMKCICPIVLRYFVTSVKQEA